MVKARLGLVLCFLGFQVLGCDPGSFYDGSTCEQCPTDPPGLYCYNSQKGVCPGGYYCPDPATSVLCPSGSSCPEGSATPVSCGPLRLLECASPGLAKPRSIYLGLIIFGIVLLLWVMTLFYLSVSKYCDLKHFEDLQKTLANVTGGKRKASIDQLKITLPRKVEIRFDNIGFELPGRKVLQDITGIFRPGELTAVMGPSGCGKSSLLNVLSGRTNSGLISGSIYVNDERVDSLYPYRQVIGFVPQDDVMYSDLTVDDNLLYSRLLFSADSFEGRRQEKSSAWDVVYAVVNTLNLVKIHTKKVGDAEKRGISGGERKRVSVGMEVVRTPAVLLLDEPTSGLDSSTAVQLVGTLQELAKAGMCVVSVVHQPRYEIFMKFDRLILLNHNGRMVYSGPASSAEDYFLTLGFPIPPRVNLADHIMDVMMGLRKVPHARKIGEAKEEQPLKDEEFKLESDVSEKDKAAINRYLTAKWKEQQIVNDQFFKPYDKQFGPLAERRDIEALPTPEESRWNQFVYVMERQFTQLIRAHRTFFLDNLLGFVVGVIIAALFGDMSITGNLAAELPAIQLALALPGTVVGLRIFGLDRDIYVRESFNGMSPTAYFMGKFCGTVPHLLLPPLVFLAGFYALMRPRGSVGDFYTVFLLTQWAVVGVSCMVSLTFQKKNSSFVALIIVLLFLISNGLSPRTSVLENNLGWFGTLLNGISYLRFTAEAIALADFRGYPPVLFDEQMDAFLQPSGWSRGDWKKVTWGLFVHGIVTRVLCWIWLRFGDKILGFFKFIDIYIRHLMTCGKLDRSDSQLPLRQQSSRQGTDERRNSVEIPLRTSSLGGSEASAPHHPMDHSDFYTETRRNSLSDRRGSGDYSLHAPVLHPPDTKVRLYDNYSPAGPSRYSNGGTPERGRTSSLDSSDTPSSAPSPSHSGSAGGVSSGGGGMYLTPSRPPNTNSENRVNRAVQDIEFKSLPLPSHSQPQLPLPPISHSQPFPKQPIEPSYNYHQPSPPKVTTDKTPLSPGGGGVPASQHPTPQIPPQYPPTSFHYPIVVAQPATYSMASAPSLTPPPTRHSHSFANTSPALVSSDTSSGVSGRPRQGLTGSRGGGAATSGGERDEYVLDEVEGR